MFILVYKVLSLALILARPVELRVVDILTGPESQANAGVRLISSERAWSQMWGEHQDVLSADGSPVDMLVAPKFDFSKVTILAIIGDSRTDSAGFEVDKINLAKDGWELHVSPIVDNHGQVRLAGKPFAFVVIPRLDRSLTVWLSQKGKATEQIARFDSTVNKGEARSTAWITQ
jgi:hypothetical protein